MEVVADRLDEEGSWKMAVALLEGALMEKGLPEEKARLHLKASRILVRVHDEVHDARTHAQKAVRLCGEACSGGWMGGGVDGSSDAEERSASAEMPGASATGILLCVAGRYEK